MALPEGMRFLIESTTPISVYHQPGYGLEHLLWGMCQIWVTLLGILQNQNQLPQAGMSLCDVL